MSRNSAEISSIVSRYGYHIDNNDNIVLSALYGDCIPVEAFYPRFCDMYINEEWRISISPVPNESLMTIMKLKSDRWNSLLDKQDDTDFYYTLSIAIDRKDNNCLFSFTIEQSDKNTKKIVELNHYQYGSDIPKMINELIRCGFREYMDGDSN